MMKRLTFAALFFALLAAPSLHADVTVSFASNLYVFNEGTTVTVTVVRTGEVDKFGTNLSYVWSVGDTFIPGLSGSGSVTFAAGETSKDLIIPIADDQFYTSTANNVAGTMSLVTSLGAVVARTSIRYVDNDPMPTLIAPPTVSVPEGNSGNTSVTLHYKLSVAFGNPQFGPVKPSGSLNQNDYDVPGFGFVSVSRGQTDFDIVVNIHGDLLSESDEYIDLDVGVGPAHVSSTAVVILNDDFELQPKAQMIQRGRDGSITLSTSVAATSTERIMLVSSDPGIATVAPFVDLPPGQTTVTVPIHGLSPGLSVITIALPPSRGNASMEAEADVFEPTELAFERSPLELTLGAAGTAKVRLAPLPLRPLALQIANSAPAVVDVPQSFTIGIDGNGSFPIRAIGTGASTIALTLPLAYGGGMSQLRITVSQPTGLSISGLSATSGPAVGNQLVTLLGNDIKGRCSVTFGGVAALNTSVAANGTVATYTPPHATGVVDVGIRCGTAEFTFAKAYTYTASPLRLTGIAPAAGAAEGGTIVTARGENLSRGRCALWFGDSAAVTLTNLQPLEMTAIAPAHAPGAVAVTLRCGGDTATLQNAFVYAGQEPAADIAAISPSSASPGERILIGGSRFRVSDTVALGGVAALDMTTSATEHVVTVPEIGAGTMPVTLRDAEGRTISGPPFTVKPIAPPQITSAPAKVTSGGELVVNGSGFRAALSFLLGGVPLTRVVVAPTLVVLRVPRSLQPQATTFAVADAAGTPLASRPMEVVATGVAVASASPRCMSTEGGALVTISGSGFQPGAVVTFGLADATEVDVRDANTIVARAPASSGVSDATITVTNPSLESGQLTGAFQYRWPDSGCGSGKHRPARH